MFQKQGQTEFLDKKADLYHNHTAAFTCVSIPTQGPEQVFWCLPLLPSALLPHKRPLTKAEAVSNA